MFNFKKNISLIILTIQFTFLTSFGYTNIDEIDTLKAELACQKDKTSQVYIKNKQKLDKLIAQSQIDYSTPSRIKDIERLISQQKYNSAIYEINDLIENKIELSKCHEYMADIYQLTSKHPSKIANLYKKALSEDSSNMSAAIKLAKLYLKENKNILGTECLKKAISISNDNKYYNDIESLILYGAKPQNKYEANNLYEALAMLYMKSGRNQDGYMAMSKALELNPDDIWLKYQFANILYINRQDQSAINVYNSILKEYPYDSQIRNSKAKLLIRNGNLLSANKEYLTILNQYPDSNQARYGIYQIYKDRLSPEQILFKFHENNQSYTIDKNEVKTFINFLKAIKDYKGSELFSEYLNELNIKEEKARQEALKQKEYHQAGLTGQKNYQQLNKIKEFENTESEKINKTTQTKKTTKQITQQKTQQIQPKKDKKEKIQQQKAEKQPKEVIKKEVEQKNKETAKISKEQELKNKIKETEKSDIQKAQKELKEAQEKNSKYKEYNKIIENYLNTKPLTSSIYIAVANTYKQANMPYNAIKYFNEAKKIDPINSEIYYNIGLTYMELNRLSESKEYIEKAINLNNQDKKYKTLLSFVNQKITTSIINKAYGDFENKKYIEAFSILDNAIKQIPNNAQLYYYRAIVADAMNRNASAIMDLQKTTEIDPSYYMAYYQLGKSYEKIKDNKNALVAYERFLSIEPDEKELVNEIQKKVIDLAKKYY